MTYVKTNPNDPVSYVGFVAEDTEGLTKREAFAMAALPEAMGQCSKRVAELSPAALAAKAAVYQADALIAALNEVKPIAKCQHKNTLAESAQTNFKPKTKCADCGHEFGT